MNPAWPELLVVFGLLAFWIALVVWVYRDALRRGANAPFWAAIVFFLHFIGFVVYLVARPTSKTSGGFA